MPYKSFSNTVDSLVTGQNLDIGVHQSSTVTSNEMYRCAEELRVSRTQKAWNPSRCAQ